MGDPRRDGNDFARLIPGLVQEGVPGIRVEDYVAEHYLANQRRRVRVACTRGRRRNHAPRPAREHTR
jgi:hypothetical protein